MHKVLFNTWNAAFFIKGGGEVQLLESKRALEQKGCSIDLYDMWNPQKDFDIFHQFSSVPGVEYVIDAYKSLGKKIVISPIFWDELTEDYPLHYHYKNLFPKADLLMTNSDAESEKISRLFSIPLDKFQKTRNSITDDYLVKGNRELFLKQFNISVPFVLTVANIDERKNTARLVEACERLKIKLVSIGNVRHPHILKSFENSPYFRHLGPISDKEILKSAFCSCSLFALPSMCETPGIAALEAASQGAKILITQEGSAKEYFEDYATYVDPWSVDSITTGMDIALSSSHKDISTFIRETYTWSNTADDIIKGYEKIF